jgi:hypothetical protein
MRGGAAAAAAARRRSSSRAHLLLLLLLAMTNGASAQLLVPPAPNNGTCPLSVLYGRIATLNTACCAAAGTASGSAAATTCPGGVPVACSPTCGAVLIPLLDDCDEMLDMIFDATDGREDGVAGIFRNLASRCNTLPSAEILTAIRPLIAAGQCPAEWTEGVGTTAVAADTCSDARANCQQLVGLLSCSADFCRGTQCSMRGQCDQTCGFCVTTPPQNGHRRAQIGNTSCAPGTFSADVMAANAACCDVANGCVGVPTECDARCGVVFVDFYSKCRSVLHAYSNSNVVSAYERLYQTCATQLPAVDLLRLLARCSQDPCANVNCGLHGSCSYNTNGTCTCTSGFTGANCENDTDECASSPCRNGATCTDAIDNYSCACAAGFAGATCGANIDDCASTPCQNGGICTDAINGYTCACATGFAGAACGTNIDDCASTPCQNGGVCTDVINGYTCACTNRYTGNQCQTQPPPCCSTISERCRPAHCAAVCCVCVGGRRRVR